jgi:hypothetical protein
MFLSGLDRCLIGASFSMMSIERGKNTDSLLGWLSETAIVRLPRTVVLNEVEASGGRTAGTEGTIPFII